MSKAEAARLLDALENEEKKVLGKVRSKKGKKGKPADPKKKEKDW